MRFRKIKIGIDFDDVLAEFNEEAVRRANLKYRFDPPLSINELNKWEARGDRSDVVFEFYKEPTMFTEQKPLPGAQEFIKKLTRIAEVFIITAVSPQFMGYRAQRIIELFPEIPSGNIIMGARKDLMKVDVLLDDGSHNIISSKADYPVLLRKPWNQHMTGGLAVNNYDEFLELVKTIISSSTEPVISGNKAVILVGPTGSGKTDLIRRAVDAGVARRIRSTSTSKKNDEYIKVSQEEFLKMESEGKFFETTRYAGNCYGITYEEVESNIGDGPVIAAMDICGAIAMKRAFPENTVLVFVKRGMKNLIRAIIARDTDDEEKASRIICLPDEMKNEVLCDETVENTGNIEESFKELVRIIKN